MVNKSKLAVYREKADHANLLTAYDNNLFYRLPVFPGKLAYDLLLDDLSMVVETDKGLIIVLGGRPCPSGSTFFLRYGGGGSVSSALKGYC